MVISDPITSKAQDHQCILPLPLAVLDMIRAPGILGFFSLASIRLGRGRTAGVVGV